MLEKVGVEGTPSRKTDYDLVATKTVTAKTGSTILAVDDARNSTHLGGRTDVDYFVNAGTSLEETGAVAVKGDGTTTVKVFFNRKTYTLNFNLNKSSATLEIGGNTYSSNQYSFTAKYESFIANKWPTVVHSGDNTECTGFQHGNDTKRATKRIQLSSDLIGKTIVITANTNSKMYDGSALTDDGYTYTANVLAEGDVLTAVVEGSQTDAGVSENIVTSYAVKRGEKDVTEYYSFGDCVDGTLTVNPRAVTLTSADAEKEYDGTPLTNGTVTMTGDGFADGEGYTTSVTGSQTEVGSSDNTFTYALNEGTKAANYDITKVEGTLTVTAVSTPIVITANSNEKMYDGSALTDSGYTFTDGVLKGSDTLEAVVEGSQTDAGESANVVTSYAVKRGDADVTNYYTFGTSVDGTLTVTKRPITLTSATDEKVYDGTPLTNSTVTLDGSFATGEGYTTSVTGSQTDVGHSDNTFTYTLNEGTKADNYDISTVTGTLTVTAITTPIVITANSKEKLYDGTALTEAGYSYTEDVLVEGDVLTATVSGSQTDVGVGANVVTSYAVMRNGTDVTGNYTFGESVDGKLTVTPRKIVLTSDTDSKVYDGTPLTAKTVTVSGDGFIGSDGAEFNVTGTRTDVGKSDNTFDYTLKQGTKAINYSIEKELGTLTITPITTEIIITAKSASQIYDGTTLKNSEYTYTEGVLLEGDVLEAVVTGSQTDVGETANAVTSYRVLRGTTDVTGNYTFGDSVDGSGNGCSSPYSPPQPEETGKRTRKGDG